MKNVGKKVLVMLLTVLMLCSMAAVGVSAAPADYIAIGLGDTVAVTVAADGVEYLRFVPEEDGYYVFYAEGDEDTCASLLNADEEAIAYDDDSGDGYNFSMEAFLWAGEEYYVSVWLYSESGGTFTVTATTRVSMEIAVGEYSAVTLPYDEWVTLEFTPEESGWHTIYSVGDADTIGYLMDVEYTSLTLNDDNGEGQNFALVYYLEAGYTYYVDMRAIDAEESVECAVTAEPVEDVESLFDAEDIGIDETWTVYPAETEDDCCFRFVPEISGEYTFSSFGDADPYCVMYDMQYNAVGIYDDIDYYEGLLNFEVTSYLEAGVTYYFVTSSYDFVEFYVTLSANDVDPVFEIAVGEDQEVPVEDGWGERYFLFSPVTDGWYCFTSAGEFDTVAEVYEAYNDTISISNNNDGEGNNFRAVTYCEVGVAYYLYTVGEGDGDGSYIVSVNPVSESNLFPNAAAIKAKDTKPVYLDADSGCVTYRFVPTVSGTYTLYSTGDADSYCYLYDVDGRRIVKADDYYFSEDFNFVLTDDFVAGKTYYFQLSAYQYDADTAEYEVHLQSGGFDTLRAELIEVNQTKTLYAEYEEDANYNTFLPAESGWYRFAFEVEGYLDASLLDRDGYYLLNAYNGDTAGDFDLLCYCEGGEEYYLQTLLYGEGSYTVTVTQADGNRLFPNATTISAGQAKTVAGKTYYRFVPTVSGVYTFASAADGETDPYCEVYDVTGGTVDTYDDMDYDEGAYNFSLTDYFIAGQVYYFCVDTYGEDGQSFTVTLTKDADATVVDKVRVENLPVPQEGQTVGAYCDALWALTTDPALEVWEVAVFQDDIWMEEDETFAAGESYLVAFVLATEGVFFTDDCTVTANAGTVSAAEISEGVLVVCVDITVSGDEPAAKPGDVNGDGRVNNRDLGMLQQYLSDWDVEIDLDAADVNDDGRVNNRDLGLIQQYLGDWDIELI